MEGERRKATFVCAFDGLVTAPIIIGNFQELVAEIAAVTIGTWVLLGELADEFTDAATYFKHPARKIGWKVLGYPIFNWLPGVVRVLNASQVQAKLPLDHPIVVFIRIGPEFSFRFVGVKGNVFAVENRLGKRKMRHKMKLKR